MILEVNDKLIMGGAEIETYEYSTISLQHVNHPNTTSQKYLARTAVGTIRSISTIFGQANTYYMYDIVLSIFVTVQI